MQIRDVWLKENAPGPLGDRLSCFESVYHRNWTFDLHETFKVDAGTPW